MSRPSNTTIGALVLALGFIISSAILGSYALAVKNKNRFVQVKGLAEKEVTADLGSWSLSSTVNSNTQDEVTKAIKKNVAVIKEFLMEYGFEEKEISVENINIRANNYQGSISAFTAEAKVSVTSTKVDLINVANNNIDQLLSKGIILYGDRWSNGPKYYFTKINEVKPELLAEALQAAKQSAKEFAANSGSKVGEIKWANQGIIVLIPANRADESHQYYKKKIVRVVSSVDYFLE